MIQCELIKFDDLLTDLEEIIHYAFQETPFGICLFGFLKINNNQNIICNLSYPDPTNEQSFNHEVQSMKIRFPKAKFISDEKETKLMIDLIFKKAKVPNAMTHLKVILKGTDFQMKVWEALTKIPFGTLTTYQAVAEAVNNPKAARGVGAALKANQIGYLIPCHRVICKNGCNKFSWCTDIKIKMQNFEKTLKK